MMKDVVKVQMGLKVERNEIEQSLTGVYEVMGSIGQFVSANGKTDSLSDKNFNQWFYCGN